MIFIIKERKSEVLGITVAKPLLRRWATWDAYDLSASFLGSIDNANFELLCQNAYLVVRASIPFKLQKIE